MNEKIEIMSSIPDLTTVASIYLVIDEEEDIYLGSDFEDEFISEYMVTDITDKIHNLVMELDAPKFNEILLSSKNLVDIQIDKDKKFFVVKFHESLPIANIEPIQ